MIDYKSIEIAKAIPEADSMIETFRAIGYNLESAIADIIDNSISAGAKNIRIQRIWRGGHSILTIEDDGHGMNNNELIQAMRPGAQNPLLARSEVDLGRFGLGLKTASFSQCRKLTVISKKDGYVPVYWTWDLDYVSECKEWNLLRWCPEEFQQVFNKDSHSGTMVIWADMDRVIPLDTEENDETAKAKFSAQFDRVKNHLAMTFHRFIEDKTIRIYWGEHEIEPWNPFCTSEDKTQPFPDEEIYNGKGASIKGYVLPHRKNFSSELAYRNAEGIKGWVEQQGFYIYRGKRLLLAGDWLGLFRKEEHYKLARIRIDLPNTQDDLWQIDIKKSTARPPIAYINQLKAYANSVRVSAVNVYRHRGRVIKTKAGTSFSPLWLDKNKDGKWSFVINRDNDVIVSLMELANTKPKQAINMILRFVEESLPIPSIHIKDASQENENKEPFSDMPTSTIQTVLECAYNNHLAAGMSPQQAKDLLRFQEPFNLYEDLIDQL